MLHPARRPGLSLAELLVATAVTAVLVGVLLAAVQRARESANRTRCRNNLKQIGLAQHNHLEAHGRFAVTTGGEGQPYNGPPRASVFVYLLPHLDQGPLFEAWDFGYHWYHDQNAGPRSTRVKTFECPSAVPAAGFVATEYGPGDNPADPWRVRLWAYTRHRPAPFHVIAVSGEGGMDLVDGVRPVLVRDVAVGHYGPYDALNHPVRAVLPGVPFDDLDPELPGKRIAFGALFADGRGTPVPGRVTDGLSQTIFFAEDAGRPIEYELRAPRPGTAYTVTGAGWASAKVDFGLNYISRATGRFFNPDVAIDPNWPDPCVMNCNSDNEAYSFHPGGCHVLLGDGSVRWVSEAIPLPVWAAAVTPAAGDVLPADW